MVYRLRNFPVDAINEGDLIQLVCLGEEHVIEVRADRLSHAQGYQNMIRLFHFIGLGSGDDRSMFFNMIYGRDTPMDQLFPNWQNEVEKVNIINAIIDLFKSKINAENIQPKSKLSIVDRGGNVFDITVNKKTIRVYSPLFTVKKNDKCQSTT